MSKIAVVMTAAASLMALGACTVNTPAVAPAPTPTTTIITPPPPALTPAPGNTVVVPGRY